MPNAVETSKISSVSRPGLAGAPGGGYLVAEAAWAALVFLAATCRRRGKEGWTRARKDLERRLHQKAGG